MRLLDRLMSKLGYVPAERLTEVVENVAWCDDCECLTPTVTMVNPRPHIILSADFKRNKLCS